MTLNGRNEPEVAFFLEGKAEQSFTATSSFHSLLFNLRMYTVIQK